MRRKFKLKLFKKC